MGCHCGNSNVTPWEKPCYTIESRAVPAPWTAVFLCSGAQTNEKDKKSNLGGREESSRPPHRYVAVLYVYCL